MWCFEWSLSSNQSEDCNHALLSEDDINQQHVSLMRQQQKTVKGVDRVLYTKKRNMGEEVIPFVSFSDTKICDLSK